MSVVASDGEGQLVGTYFYKEDLRDVRLRGFVRRRDVTLSEYSSDGQLRGTFQLHMPERDPNGRLSGTLQGEVLTGEWTDNHSTQPLPVHLELQDILTGYHDLTMRYASTGAASDVELERNAQSFYFAVLKGDKAVASGFVRYPLRANSQGSQKAIRNQAEFMRDYQQIFTPKYTDCIRAATPHNMFVHEGAAMLGNGEIWFDREGFVIAINSCVSR